MLDELIQYESQIPVKISMVSIEEYPIHFHENDLELFVILEGEVKLIEGYRTMLLRKGDVFIVNEWELHGIYSTGLPNKLLMIQINLTHFQRYNHEFSNFFLMADSYSGDKKVRSFEHELKQNIFILAEVFLKNDHSEVSLSKKTTEFLTYLRDNFKYFAVHEDSYFVNRIDQKENEIQVQRVREIYNYILGNFSEKITLKEYAEQNHLNMYYLSHVITDTTGLSFQELLNFTRVEFSEKFLLGTDMRISEIASKCGFSAKRYYEKTFESWYKTTPEEYRLTHKKRTEAKISQIVFSGDEILQVIDSDTDYITYAGKTNESYVRVIKVDANSNLKKRILKKDHLLIINGLARFNGKTYEDDVSLLRHHLHNYARATIDITNLSEQRLFSLVESLKENINSFLLDIPAVQEPEKNWALVNKLIYYYKHHYRISSLPIHLYLTGGGKKQPKQNKFNNEEVKFHNINTMYQKDKERNIIYDSICYVPKMLAELTKGKFNQIFDMVDEERRTTKPLRGDKGLITWNGLPKPSFYGHYLFSLLGKEVLYNDQNSIITNYDDNLQILFFDFNSDNYRKFKKVDDVETLVKLINEDYEDIEIAMEIRNLFGSYRQSSVSLSVENCLLDKWADMGMNKLLSYTEELLLRKSLFPKVEFDNLDLSGEFDLKISIPRYGAKLILLEKINNCN